jgi:hypothetical protein
VTTESSVPEPPSSEITRTAEQHSLGGLRRILTRHQTVQTRHPEHYYTEDEVTTHFYEFEYGFIYQRNDEAVHVFPWKKVSRVYLGSTRNFYNKQYTGTDYYGTLILADGGNLKLKGSFHDPAYRRLVYSSKKKKASSDVEYELFRFLSAASTVVSRLQLPGALATLERGEALPFGDISISLAGIQTDRGLVPWQTISDVQLKNGSIRVEQDGKFRALSRQEAGQTPNLPLFFMLVDAIRQSQRQ